MKVLITGVAGTGKSTIGKVLREKGIQTVDFRDIPGLCFWQDKSTGERVGLPSDRDLAWFESHERVCDSVMLKEVIDQYDDLVVTGNAFTDRTAYLDLFDKVILLQCAPKEILHRIMHRERPFGKLKVEQDMILVWQKDFDPKMISYGAVPIRSDGALDEVVEKVTAELKRVTHKSFNPKHSEI